MTCRRSKIRRGGSLSSSDDSGFPVYVGVGAVLFDHLVVDPKEKKRGGPLADEEGMMVFAVGLEKKGTQNRGRCGAQKKARGQLGGVALHHGGSLIFRYFSGAYAIIHF